MRVNSSFQSVIAFETASLNLGASGGTQNTVITDKINNLNLETVPDFFLEADDVSGTAPTLDVKVQVSFNGTDWEDAATFTQVTTTAVSEAKRPTFYARQARLNIVIGGSATPTYKFKVYASGIIRGGGKF